LKGPADTFDVSWSCDGTLLSACFASGALVVQDATLFKHSSSPDDAMDVTLVPTVDGNTIVATKNDESKHDTIATEMEVNEEVSSTMESIKLKIEMPSSTESVLELHDHHKSSMRIDESPMLLSEISPEAQVNIDEKDSGINEVHNDEVMDGRNPSQNNSSSEDDVEVASEFSNQDI
jgi:hypothetical protein